MHSQSSFTLSADLDVQNNSVAFKFPIAFDNAFFDTLAAKTGNSEPTLYNSIKDCAPYGYMFFDVLKSCLIRQY